ncbi:uncharacterized protein L969DRAFT_93934 [Mixia osmundae IAM 14324]|uniref:Uncharacterized protein n=1 Tax=Mixia osmundae (strain CBS 9802 / IAM 14324 / JCM 22182 / KY 12970) TaxID=764103 RepID=G7E8K6_MIXOS|nr:uncharacterized protein L969DRAFT_93934 [Mixia osmundae IAM 14324]KEI40108.1 hypothetical protein L969DRAFT_93934 [Mixia osmundae IAM 14324]GAA99474.1 hypothetical protein E5Q_06173 [Mixia osmundae IAM 14324]
MHAGQTARYPGRIHLAVSQALQLPEHRASMGSGQQSNPLWHSSIVPRTYLLPPSASTSIKAMQVQSNPDSAYAKRFDQQGGVQRHMTKAGARRSQSSQIGGNDVFNNADRDMLDT